MSQHDLTIANQGFPAFRSDLNNALQALGSTQAGSSEPSPTFAHQLWIDTSSAPNVLKVRNADDDAWIAIGELNQSTDKFIVTAPTTGNIVGTTDTQTLTNKTISADNNTLSGIAASSFVLSNASGNIDGSAAQKVIPSGVVVGTTDTQTLTNKTLTTPTLTTPKVNVINEETSGSGVTVDGVLIKDNQISGQYTPIFRDTEKATTSGTTIDFTGIPSWVKRITVIFNQVSLNDAAQVLVRLGNAGGIETSGYVSRSSAAGSNNTGVSGFIIRVNGSANLMSGIMTLVNISGNTWIGSHAVDRGANDCSVGGGTKTLSDVLTQLQITASDGASFDNGSINIFYE